MITSNLLNKDQREVLAKARETYGDTAQILVSNEELCELAAVCAKYPRYEDGAKARKELHDKAVDEVADVMIVLDHIVNIFGLNSGEVKNRIKGKVDRLGRWLSTTSNQEQTMKDRDVYEQATIEDAMCSGCLYESVRHVDSIHCKTCGLDRVNYVKKRPCINCAYSIAFGNFNPDGICAECLRGNKCYFKPIEEESR